MATSRRKVSEAQAALVRGDSARHELAFIPDQPAWLRVGSGPNADWRIEGDGVAPEHCELLWDGRALFVQDRLRLGGTRVDGRRVDGWRPLPGDVLIYLARACVRTRSSREQAREPSPETLRWVQRRLLERPLDDATRS